MNPRKLIHDAAKCLGATIETPLEIQIMDAAIDQMGPQTPEPKASRDPLKSDAMNAALSAVDDAKQALLSTKETAAEVRRAEQ